MFTGDHPKAGTGKNNIKHLKKKSQNSSLKIEDANVYLTMFGEKNESNEIFLEDSETHKNKFERNKVKKNKKFS